MARPRPACCARDPVGVQGASLRIAMFERVLDHVMSLGQVWTPTASEVVATWKAAHHD